MILVTVTDAVATGHITVDKTIRRPPLTSIANTVSTGRKTITWAVRVIITPAGFTDTVSARTILRTVGHILNIVAHTVSAGSRNAILRAVVDIFDPRIAVTVATNNERAIRVTSCIFIKIHPLWFALFTVIWWNATIRRVIGHSVMHQSVATVSGTIAVAIVPIDVVSVVAIFIVVALLNTITTEADAISVAVRV